MKYALISPVEPRHHFDGTSGYRVAQVEEQTFDIAEPLHWIECADDVIADQYYFDTTSNSIKVIPVEPPPAPVPPSVPTK